MASTIDLHIHTNASDGTDSPEQLLWNIQKAGITTFAVTDHDTIKGALRMKRIIPPGIKFIKGIEFTCRTNNSKCHILGLNYDEHNPDFLDALRMGDHLRHEKFYVRLKLLHEKFGIDFTDSEVDSLLKSPGVGKLHLGNMIAMKGYADNAKEAMEKYVDECKSGVDKISAETAIKAINSSGGVSVWAHPLGGEREKELTESEFMTMLRELTSYGLRGLECWYSKYPVTKCKKLVQAADRYGLLVSGGSDYHGGNKMLPLGRLNSDGENIGVESLTVLRKLGG